MVDEQTPFKSAEAWLADKGVPRDPIRVAPQDPGGQQPPGPAPRAREVVRLADQAARDQAAGLTPDAPADDDEPDAAAPAGNLEDEVAKALSFIRRSTAAQPAAEGRLRRKLADRGTPGPAAEIAMRRARQERLVDDDALAAALVQERRAKGHATKRIRMDLRKRELSEEAIETALGRYDVEDPEAVAFDVARRRAAGYGALPAEKAYRRLVGYLARRGHAEGLSRKIAREVIYVEREQEQTAGH